MAPTIGRNVHYTLTAHDAAQINRRRTDGLSIATRLSVAQWPAGAQAHIGNDAHEGDVYPMMITRCWPSTGDTDIVNGQVFLDGTDVLWVTSVYEGTDPGTWAWPPRS